MIGYLDLPVGYLRILGPPDFTRNANIPGLVGFQDALIGILSNTSAPGTYPSNTAGILLQENRMNVNAGETWTFKPPLDRGWLIAQIGLVLVADTPAGSCTWNPGDIQIDNLSVASITGPTINVNRQNVLLLGPGTQIQTPAGPNTYFPYSARPIGLDPTFFVPLRNTLAFIISVGTTNTQGGAVGVVVTVWEYYKTAPIAPATNPVPAQKANQSWL